VQETPTHAAVVQLPWKQTDRGSQAPPSQLPGRHWPAAQRVPFGHAMPHMPQLDESVTTFTHAPPHDVSPGAQPQAPEWQVRPDGQTTPTQSRSTQALFTQTLNASQLNEQSRVRQAEPAHDSPAAHALPHMPQFASSSARSTQLSPHCVRPGPQTQWPCEQTSPTPHATPTHARATHAP
jgi:hypothetical protein